jgi:hypothetical protein
MKTTVKITESVPVRTLSVRRFQLRLHVEAPFEIDDTELMDAQDLRAVGGRMMVNVARASYMVNGPNREVFWEINLWSTKRHRWEQIAEGKSRQKDTILANTNPFRTDRAKYPRDLG